MSKEQKITVARIVFAVAVTLILGIIGLPDILPLKILIYLIPYLVIGYNVLYSAGRNILNGQVFDEQFLMTLATIGAFVIGEYPEAVMVMTFFQIGELFEKLAVGKSRKSITELMDIIPDTANLLKDKTIVTVSPEEVSKGDIIVVRPGEKIPLDGVITEGETYVDTSALTGESLPRKSSVGDSVISGCVNMQSLIYIRVESEFYDSTATKILELVESSTMKKAKTESFITKFARYYTPSVVIGAVLISIIAAIITGEIFESIRRGLVFLVVSCPCALVISVPLSFFGGIGGASKNGILIKGSEFIEALSKTDIAVFDKTGTLTEGRFTISELVCHDISRTEFLEYAAHAESASTHPIAKCICKEYGKEIDISKVQNMTEYAGGGIGATYNGKRILIGNKRLIEKNSITADDDPGEQNTVFMALDNKYVGYITLDDKPKKSSKSAIDKLKALGISKTVMLTGDIRSTAEKVGKELYVDEIYAELMPKDKVRICEELLEKKKKGRTLIFAGDGINDAPVLSRADVGIAMGAMGSDAAIEAADVVLMDDDPEKVSRAIGIAKKTMRIVKQNIIFALSVKGIVLLLGAFGYANMWIAVFADVGVSVLAILNAMRAMRISSKK